MKRLIEFSLETGNSISVEVEDVEGNLIPAASPNEVITRASQTFEDTLEKIKPAANVMITKLRELSHSPDEVQVEFGIKFSAEVGAIISSVSGEANYKVTLMWKQKDLNRISS